MPRRWRRSNCAVAWRGFSPRSKRLTASSRRCGSPRSGRRTTWWCFASPAAATRTVPKWRGFWPAGRPESIAGADAAGGGGKRRSGRGLLPELRHIVATDHDAARILPRSHRVDTHLPSRRFRKVQRGLALRDVAGRHEEVHVLLRCDIELGLEVHFRPADDLAGTAVDDGSEQLAGLVVEEPDAVGLDAGVHAHGPGGHDGVLVSVVRGGSGLPRLP